MDLKELRELIEILEESALNELEIEEDGRRVRLQKSTVSAAPVMAAPAPVPVAAPQTAAPGSSGGDSPKSDKEHYESQGLSTIDAPMVGTFYSAPAPGEDAFAKVGDAITEGQTVCIVEAMKLMNEVSAKSACVIEKILVENGEPVEFGQPLFAVRTS